MPSKKPYSDMFARKKHEYEYTIYEDGDGPYILVTQPDASLMRQYLTKPDQNQPNNNVSKHVQSEFTNKSSDKQDQNAIDKVSSANQDKFLQNEIGALDSVKNNQPSNNLEDENDMYELMATAPLIPRDVEDYKARKRKEALEALNRFKTLNKPSIVNEKLQWNAQPKVTTFNKDYIVKNKGKKWNGNVNDQRELPSWINKQEMQSEYMETNVLSSYYNEQPQNERHKYHVKAKSKPQSLMMSTEESRNKKVNSSENVTITNVVGSKWAVLPSIENPPAQKQEAEMESIMDIDPSASGYTDAAWIPNIDSVVYDPKSKKWKASGYLDQVPQTEIKDKLYKEEAKKHLKGYIQMKKNVKEYDKDGRPVKRSQSVAAMLNRDKILDARNYDIYYDELNDADGGYRDEMSSSVMSTPAAMHHSYTNKQNMKPSTKSIASSNSTFQSKYSHERKGKVKRSSSLSDKKNAYNSKPSFMKSVLVSEGGVKKGPTKTLHVHMPVLTDVHKSNGHVDQTQENVKEKLHRNADLSRELQAQYGSNAEQMAIDHYGVVDHDPRNPRLIDKVLSQRTKEHSRKKDEHGLRIRSLNEERETLIKEKERLEEKKRRVQAGEINTGSGFLFLDTQHGSEPPTWHSRSTMKLPQNEKRVHDTQDFIDATNRNLPAQIARYNRLKDEHERRKEYLEKPYNGELGPQTYHRWQMEDYYMARNIVDEVVEKFLDKYFYSQPLAMSQSQTKAFMNEKARVWEKTKQNAVEAKVTQLLMEELVLEMTAVMTKEVARELRNSYAYVKNRTDMHMMRQSEAIATNNPDGRSDREGAYHLITKGYFSRQRDRNKTGSDIWAHTQHTHVAAKEDDADAPDLEVAKDGDTELLQFHHITPLDLKTYTPNRDDDYNTAANKNNYVSYLSKLRLYWMNVSAAITAVNLSERCKGITCSCPSWDGRFLALGTTHGDLLIYELLTRPYRLIKLLCNVRKYDDPIDHISWSYDGRKLLTTNVTGGSVKAWTWQPPNKDTVAVPKTDMSLMNAKADVNSLVPELMTNVLDLDVDRYDTKFQSGPFADLELHKSVYGPSMALFFPTFTLLGSQNTICVSLDNGDIIRCDVENNYQENVIQEQRSSGTAGGAVTVSQEVPKVYKPKITPQDGPSTVGQGVPVELFREHKYPIITMGFIENTRNMFSVDQQGFIYVWRYHKRQMGGFGYFDPHKKYQLDMSERMFVPVSNAKPIIVFSEKPQPDEKKKRTRQEIAQQRTKAEKVLRGLNLKDPWHKQAHEDGARTTAIYAPKNISDGGSTFHILLRHDKTKVLSTYVTRSYKPKLLYSKKLLGCKPTPDGKRLVFMLLFPAYPPKEAHISIVVVDLTTMTMVDWKRDTPLTSNDLFQRILSEDVIDFDISKDFSPTGSNYIAINIAGEIYVYSLVTGLRVARTLNKANVDRVFRGLQIGDFNFKIAETSRVMFVGLQNRLYIMVYSDGKKEKPQNKINPNVIYIIQLVDKNVRKDRLDIWKKFCAWSTHPPIAPATHRVDNIPVILEPPFYPEAFMKGIIMDLVDDIMESKYGEYSEDVMTAHEELDQVRNYEEMANDVEGRRTPFDPEDDIANQQQ